jgi:hypothetical protein
MKNLFKLLLPCWLLFTSFSSSEKHILWSQARKLEWKDFKGKVPSRTQMAAESNLQISAEQEKSTTDSFIVTVRAEFIKSNSWVRIKDGAILAHEQGHFDITEIFARKLRKEFKETSFTSRNFNSTFSKLYSKTWNDYRAMEKQYDKETDHSRKYEKQEEWFVKISTELKMLEEFADPAVYISFNH